MKKYFFSVFFFVLISGCTITEEDEDEEFILKGNIESEEYLNLSIEELTVNDLRVLDSIQTNSAGNFTYRKDIDDAGFYIVRVDRNNFVTLLIEPGENIKLTGEAEDLPLTYEVKGSEGSELLSKLNKRLHTNLAKVDSLADLYRESRYEPNFDQIHHELNKAYTDIFIDHREFVKQFIKDNPYSLASIIALYQYFGNRVVLNKNEDFEYFEKLSKTLSKKHPTNKHVIDLKKRVSEIKRKRRQKEKAEEKLAIGNLAPEIVLPDPEGNLISLSSLRGNIVLIDFWASWHDPCQVQNEKLLEVYNKYKDQDFEIYGVSLDRTRKQWVSAINEKDLDWIHVSDLRYFNSPVVNLYNIQNIPYTLLIDREGKIVAKDVDHQELEEYLEDLL